MAAVSLANVRQRIAVRVATVTGFTESRLPLDLFGLVPESVGHRRFAVKVSASDPLETRQAVRNGLYLQTRVLVRFAYRLRPKDIKTDVDLATDAEELVIAAILADDATLKASLSVQYLSTLGRTVTSSGEYHLTELQFEALHRTTL